MPFAVACAGTVVACSSGTPVEVRNRSSMTLHDVSVRGSGFEQSVAATLAPGQARTVSVRPKGDSGLAISFIADSRRVSHAENGYFEGNGFYTVQVIVQPDLSASVEGKLSRAW
jgi:hypothetical protein